ncbi:MAG: hypothetical protein VXZ72_03950 [Chlamydiota bacterium]|nr:hypothetical protein [Chlamydiota bacterium]
MKERILFKGEPVTADSVLTSLVDGDLTIEDLETGSWVEAEYTSMLELSYEEGFCYEVDLYEVDPDIDWSKYSPDDLSVKWDLLTLSPMLYRIFLYQGENRQYELPEFSPPEECDYKRPDKLSLDNSRWDTPLTFDDVRWLDEWGELCDFVTELTEQEDEED